MWKGLAEQVSDPKVTTLEVKALGPSAAREIGTVSLMTKGTAPQEITGRVMVVCREKVGASGNSQPKCGTTASQEHSFSYSTHLNDVRYWHLADVGLLRRKCLLIIQSGTLEWSILYRSLSCTRVRCRRPNRQLKAAGFQFVCQEAEPVLGVRDLTPKHVGQKETSCSYQKSCRQSREPVSYREPARAFSPQSSSASNKNEDGRSEARPRKSQTKVPKTLLCLCSRRSASITSSTPPRPRQP